MSDQPKPPDPASEDVFGDALKTFHVTSVKEIWAKALARRIDDPANAITLARTLLESVCKIILDGTSTKYSARLPLPELYKLTAKALIVAPTPTTEEIFSKMLAACTDVVWGVGMLRNSLSDAHGRGLSGASGTPDWRHAELAINLAGAMATYLLAIWENRQPTVGALITAQLEAPERERPKGTHLGILQFLRSRPIGGKIAAWLTYDDLAEHCRLRAAEGAAPATVGQDISYIRSVLRKARISVEVIQEAIPVLTEQGLIGKSKERLRRPTPEEISRLLVYFREQDKISEIPMVTLVEFAAASGRTISEVTKLKWNDLNEAKRTCAIDGRDFPLFGKAWDIAVSQPRVKDQIFPYYSKSASIRFTNAKKALQLSKELVFNDLRIEAMCRLLESGYGIDEVSAATGQRDHNIIARIKDTLINRPRAGGQER